LSEETRKTFILDTSVLVYHEDSIHAFPNNDVIIPMEVLEEIDGLKKRHDLVGNAARYVNRFLDDLRKQGSLKDGVDLENGQNISVSLDSDLSILPKGMENTRDNRIISIALDASKRKDNIVLISRDINVRVKCDSLGIEAENYHKDKAIVNRKEAYTGVSVLHFSPKEIEKFYDSGKLMTDLEDLYPNEYLVLKGGKQSALATYKDGVIKKLGITSRKGFNAQGVSPRNKEQTFALEMLMNKDIHMVTLTGKAGSGKTLLSTAAAIQMLSENMYEKIVISRPVQSLSGDIGYLPGSKFDKMEPWIQPIIDNLKYIFKNGEHYFDVMMQKGTIEIEALSYVRGRSLPNTIFILDEAQNINYKEAKAVITRMGENSKLILLGDLDQIDAPHLDSTTCGLGAVVEKFKDFGLSAHITLLKGERSPLAAYAAKIL
tara:strand:- start:4548 stop:5843 length:1296 start_codon:yes stop_codon:yes gene_type:complete